MFKSSCALAIGALTALLAAAPASAGDRIYGIDEAAPPHVVSFDSGAPGTFLTDVPISGIGAGEAVVGLDSRPLDGSLWLVTIDSGVGRLYTVNPATGAATLEQTLSADATDTTDPYTTLGAQPYGVDFNPVPDRLRIVGKSDDKSMRVNPATGAVFTDANINPPGPGIAGVAYLNPVPGASTTTLFAYDYQNDFVGILNPPNNGTFNLLGDSTITAGSDTRTNLDIAPSGVGYATHQIGAGPALFTWSLSTGVHTLVGITPAGLVGMTASTANLAAVTSTAPTAGEQASSIALTVVRDNPRGTLGLTWSTAPGTAEAGSDYTSMGGALTFAPGQVSRTVTIPLLDDNTDEPDESFTVTFAPTGNQDGTVLVPTATVTIADDDPTPAAAPDRDGDGVADATDNCPNVSNVDQADGNGNGLGTVCDPAEAPYAPPATTPRRRRQTVTPTASPTRPTTARASATPTRRTSTATGSAPCATRASRRCSRRVSARTRRRAPRRTTRCSARRWATS